MTLTQVEISHFMNPTKVRSIAYLSSALSYEEKGLSKEAIHNCSKAIALDPDEPILYPGERTS